MPSTFLSIGQNKSLFVKNILLSTLFIIGTAVVVLVSSYVGLLVQLPLIIISILFLSVVYFLLSGKKITAPLLIVFLIQFTIMPLLYMVSGVAIYALLQIYMMIVGVVFIRPLVNAVISDKYLIFSTYFLALYFTLLCVSTVLSSGFSFNKMAVAYQLIADIKPYLILSFAFCLVDKYRDQVFSVIDLFGRKVWLVLLLLIALQFLATSFFKSLFPFSYIGYDESGLFPSRALGFFENSSYLASFSAFYATFYFTCFLAKISARQSHKDLLLFVAYFCMLVFAIQRQELAALFIVLLFSFIFFKNQAWSTRLIIAVAGLALGVVIFIMLFGGMTSHEFATWGGNQYAPITHPRANLYVGAYQLALDNFPLGSGLGTYAGAGSTKFNLELFYKLGFAKLWWFGARKEDYLMDSYWANPLAEAGLLGALFLLAHYLFLVVALVNKLIKSQAQMRFYALLACAATIYLLLTSATSPSFVEPRIIVFPFIAIALAYSNQTRQEEIK